MARHPTSRISTTECIRLVVIPLDVVAPVDLDAVTCGQNAEIAVLVPDDEARRAFLGRNVGRVDFQATFEVRIRGDRVPDPQRRRQQADQVPGRRRTPDRLRAAGGSSSVGRAAAFQAACREFEPRLPLHSPGLGLRASDSVKLHACPRTRRAPREDTIQPRRAASRTRPAGPLVDPGSEVDRVAAYPAP